jgi:arginyl-tRNA synthetase
VQYAHARIAGIGRKSGRDVAAIAAGADARILLDHAKERELALHLCK